MAGSPRGYKGGGGGLSSGVARQEVEKDVGQAALVVEPRLTARFFGVGSLEWRQVVQLGVGQDGRERFADVPRMDRVVPGHDARRQLYRAQPTAVHTDDRQVSAVQEELAPAEHGFDELSHLYVQQTFAIVWHARAPLGVVRRLDDGSHPTRLRCRNVLPVVQLRQLLSGGPAP